MPRPRFQIELQAPQRAADGTTSYVTKATVWPESIATLNSDEAILAMQTTGTAVVIIVIRYRSDVKSNWRIKIGDKFMAIIGPPDNVRREFRWLKIKAKEAA